MQKSFSWHKRRPMMASQFLENLMNRNENTSTSQVSCPTGSSVQEKHTPYTNIHHPEPPYNSSVRNIWKKNPALLEGLFVWNLGLEICCTARWGWNLKRYLAAMLHQLPGSTEKDFWRSSGKVPALQCDVALKSLLWLGKKLFNIGKRRMIGGTPWNLLEEGNEVMNLHPLAK